MGFEAENLNDCNAISSVYTDRMEDYAGLVGMHRSSGSSVCTDRGMQRPPAAPYATRQQGLLIPWDGYQLNSAGYGCEYGTHKPKGGGASAPLPI